MEKSGGVYLDLPLALPISLALVLKYIKMVVEHFLFPIAWLFSFWGFLC
jgi:hypothetical protein